MNRLFVQHNWSTTIQLDGCVHMSGENQRQNRLRLSKLSFAAVLSSLCLHTLVIFSMSNLTPPHPATEIRPFYLYTAYLADPQPQPKPRRIDTPADRILPAPPANDNDAAPITTFSAAAEPDSPQSPPDQPRVTTPAAIPSLLPPVKKLVPVRRKLPHMPEKNQELSAVTPQILQSDGEPVESENTPIPVSSENIKTEPATKEQSGNASGNRQNPGATQQFLTKNIDDIGGKVMAALQYPAIARRMKWQGLSVIGFVLHSSGEVTDFTVEKSSGHEILDKHAIAAVKAAAPFSGAPEEVAVVLPIRFHLD